MLSVAVAIAGVLLSAGSPQIETLTSPPHDIAPPPAAGSNLIQNLPLDPADRATLQAAVDSRDYARAEVLQ